MPDKSTGRLGEDAAAGYLCQKGYTIVQKNFRTRFGEIDIIACNAAYIVFAEVKTRKRNALLLPREAVDEKKQRRLIKATLDYLSTHGIGDLQPRFDVIEVYTAAGNDFRLDGINQIESAFTL
jgi:Predicted endonuclease distantly related to archaeal Holliday junction resolvase